MAAERAQFINRLLGSISHLKYDVGSCAADLTRLVDTVNALLVPKAWIGINDEGLLHVTYMTTERTSFNGGMWKPGPVSLMMHADYAWEYVPWEQSYRCLKCRTDKFCTGQIVMAISTAEPRKCNFGPAGDRLNP